MLYCWEVFIKYGLSFDEWFCGSVVREEFDFCLRLWWIGYYIWFDLEVFLVYLGEESGGCYDIFIRFFKY